MSPEDLPKEDLEPLELFHNSVKIDITVEDSVFSIITLNDKI